MRILLIEDDALFADVLKQSLIKSNYAVDVVNQGQSGYEYAQAPGTFYDLMIIDVGLPILDGISLCRKLRKQGNTTPILLITAKNSASERVRGLDAGADDHLVKSADLEEFHARIRALRRRGDLATPPVLKLGELELDPAECQVTYASRLLKLTPKEYGLLELLLSHPGRVFSRGAIIEHLWSFDDPPQEDTVKSHIKSLRKKLRIAGAPEDVIENIHRMGYYLNPQCFVEPKLSSSEVSDPSSLIPSPTLLNPTTVDEQFQKQLAELWIQNQGLIQERLTHLQNCADALQSQTLTPSICREAQQAAHKLAGGLGMFGKFEETKLASYIEELLEQIDGGNFQAQSLLLEPIELLVSRLQADLKASAIAEIAPRSDQPVLKRLPSSGKSATYRVQNWRVLVVDDDPIIAQVLHNCLSPWGMQVTGLEDPRLFWEVLPQVTPDLVILDVAMPHIDGVQLCYEIRETVEWQALPVIFLTRHTDSHIVQNLFIAGADDYVVKPVVGAELVARINNRLERLQLLQSLSTKDSLTGLANYAQSARSLTRLLQEHQVVVLSVLVWQDLHTIKVQYGPSLCHQVLWQCGQLIRAHFSDPALVGYWGDGEFVVGLSGVEGIEVGDRMTILLGALRRQVFTTPDGQTLPIHCVGAIAEYPKQGETLQALYQGAYRQLKPALN